MFYNVVQTSSEISPSLGLLLKVCDWYRCQSRIEKYHHDEEQLTFYQKLLHIKTQVRKEECFCNLCIATNSNLLAKTVLNAKSNGTFNINKVDLDEW